MAVNGLHHYPSRVVKVAAGVALWGPAWAAASAGSVEGAAGEGEEEAAAAVEG